MARPHRVYLGGDDIVCSIVRTQFDDAPIEIVAGDEASPDISLVASDDPTDLASMSRKAIRNDRPAVLVELGGIGGRYHDEVEGAIVCTESGGPCYRCLRTRVAAIESDDSDTGSIPANATRRIIGAVAAREVIRRINADNFGGTVIEFPWQRRYLLPVPGCPDCDSTERWTLPMQRSGSPRTLTDALDAAERAVDDRLGIVASVGEVASLPLPYYMATLADTSGFSDVEAAPRAAGVSPDWNAAYMKAVGESLERYAAGTYRSDEFERFHPDDRDDVLDPATCVRPSDAEAIDEPIDWVPGRSLLKGEHIWVPAELAVFPPPMRRIKPAITTGLALGNSSLEAIVSGLTEVLERDATMLAWYSTFEPIGVDVDDDEFETLLRRVLIDELTVSTVLLTQDIDLPVVAAAVHRDGPFPSFAMGSAANVDPVRAATGAVREAIQNWTELDAMGPDRAAREEPRIARYAETPDVARSFVTPTTSVDVAALGSDPDSPEGALELLLDRCREANLSPIVVHTTPRDLAQIGFYAVRVIIPEAQPLFTGTAYFGTRAETVPGELGFEPKLDADPHPFP